MVAPILPQSAFQAPQQPPGGVLSSTTINPIQLLDALKQLSPQTAPMKPRYPPGYRKPEKPEPAKVKMKADALYNDHQMWRNLIAVTTAWIRHERTGMFEEDREDRRNGLQEEWISTNLTTKRNKVIEQVASAKIGVSKPFYADELRRKSQMIEDAADWLMREFAYQWGVKGERDLRLDEALLFADRGMYCSRQCFDGTDPSFPLNIDLIEPTQVYPVWGGKRGLQEVYRIRRDTLEQVAADYSDFSKGTWDTLKKRYGSDRTDSTEINVYEYWDTWWKIILVDDLPIISTAHEYGYVPWTIQYGGYGDAMFTRTPSEGASSSSQWGGSFYEMANTRLSERAYKAVPLIYYDLRSHEMLEAIMGRLVTGFKREINPPLERHRSTLLAGTEMPEYSQAPGAVNEVALGEEDVKVSPQLQNQPVTGLLINTLGQETASRSVGLDDKVGQSNVSGAALNRFQTANQDHIGPIFKSLETAKAHQITQILTTIGNWHETTKYAGERVQPLMVPARRAQGIGPGFELNRELIDELGPRVEVSYSYIDSERWMSIFNSGKIGVDLGVITREEVRAEATGKTDFESHLERWMQEQAVMNAVNHPKYNELFLIPSMLLEQIQEASGDPELEQFWKERMAEWRQMAMQPEGGQGGPPGGIPGMGGPPGAPPGGSPQGGPQMAGNPMAGPPVGAGSTLPPALGPGNQGGPVGRPY